MKSMTGYGRGEAIHHGVKITTEASSVNRKQSEISLYLPREIEPLEPRVRETINKRVSRGRINIKVTLHAGESSNGPRVNLNKPLAKAYLKAMQSLATELKISGEVTLDLLMRAPGVMKAEEGLEDAEAFWPMLEKSVTQALEMLVLMRSKEGTHLARDLRQRITSMRTRVTLVKKRGPIMIAAYRDQLRARVQKAGLDAPLENDERLAKEIVYFADRSDISEEVTRLESHFKQFDACIKTTEPVGRTLDFLAQEIHREINTIGSKSADSVISGEVVELKAELEKFREQVQNVE